MNVSQKSKCKPRPKFAGSTTQRWVPKRLLTAQGYYDGVTTLWVPKQIQPNHGTSKSQVGTIPCASTAKPTWYWRPKQPSKPTITNKPQGKPTELKRKMKWVPKPQQPSKTLNETSHKVAKETIPAETPLHANMSLSTNPTIKERARALQI